MLVPVVTLQLAPVTLVALPPQPVKVGEVVPVAVAVRLTEVPLAYRAVHVPDSASGVVDVAAVCVQLICPVPSVTVPDPIPFKVTARPKVRFAPARKISGSAFVSRATRLSADEMKLTLAPSPLIAGTMLLPSEGGGVAPPAWLARNVYATHAVVVVGRTSQVSRTKTFSMPFAVLAPKLDATEAKATYCPEEQVVVADPH